MESYSLNIIYYNWNIGQEKQKYFFLAQGLTPEEPIKIFLLGIWILYPQSFGSYFTGALIILMFSSASGIVQEASHTYYSHRIKQCVSTDKMSIFPE